MTTPALAVLTPMLRWLLRRLLARRCRKVKARTSAERFEVGRGIARAVADELADACGVDRYTWHCERVDDDDEVLS